MSSPHLQESSLTDAAPALDAPVAPTESPAATPARLPLLGQRRRFLVDRRLQLRAAALAATAALLLLIVLNFGLHLARSQTTAAIVSHTPALADMLREHDRMELGLIVAASVVFLAAVFIVTILETHKTAGAAMNLAGRLDRIRDGELGVRLVLRKDDNLREVETAFNRMSHTLHEQATEELEGLEQAADEAERISNPAEARALAGTLRGMAAAKRRNLA